jgi:hypothetical protein
MLFACRFRESMTDFANRDDVTPDEGVADAPVDERSSPNAVDPSAATTTAVAKFLFTGSPPGP